MRLLSFSANLCWQGSLLLRSKSRSSFIKCLLIKLLFCHHAYIMIICFSHLIQYHNSLLALSWNRECPFELREAIASIIFASGRCSDLPELMHLRTLFTTKYGKEFVAAAMELRPDSGVDRTVRRSTNICSFQKTNLCFCLQVEHLVFLCQF